MRRALFCLIAISAAGCGAILGIPDVVLDNTIGEGGKPDVTAPMMDASPLDVAVESAVMDATDEDVSCGDTMSDPKNCGTCGHDCLGGQCKMGQCQPVLVTMNSSLIAPFSMTQTNDDLVFTNIRGAGCNSNQPCSAAKIGKGLTMGAATILANYAAYSSIDGQPWNITQANGDFYTAIQSNSASGGKWGGGVDKCSIMTGCPQMQIVIKDDVSYAVDSDGQSVFFGIRYEDVNDVTQYELWKTDLALSQNSKVVLAKGLSTDVNGVLTDASSVFYAMPDGVYKCTKSACANDKGARLTSISVEANWMAATTSDIYFVSSSSIERVSKAGGGDAQIKAGLYVPLGVAVDNAYVYFTDIGDTSNPNDGKVHRCPLSGCTQQSETILFSGDNPRPIVTDAKAVYWGTRTGKIYRLAK